MNRDNLSYAVMSMGILTGVYAAIIGTTTSATRELKKEIKEVKEEIKELRNSPKTN